MREIFKGSDSIAAKFSKASHFNGRSGKMYNVRMQTTYNHLESHAKTARWGKKVDPSNITEKQIRGFIQSRMDAGVSARTVQNEMSHLRRSLEGVGRNEFAQVTLKNSEIGVPSASRIGSGRIVDAEVLKEARENARTDTKALLDLQRSMGLRIREVVSSGASLKKWEHSLNAGNHVLTVTDGTKGGRLRDVYIRPDNVDAVKNAISACLEVVKVQGKLVDSPNLKAAMETHTDRLAKLGIKGEDSSHSLRRAFAMDQFKYYLGNGCAEKQALSLVSRDLGHGDGRGRWVYNNYLKTSMEG